MQVSTKPLGRRAKPAPGDTETRVESPTTAGPNSDAFTAAILRFLRSWPNATVNPSGMIHLTSMAEQLGVEPFEVQLAVERLADRGLVNVPFIEPDKAGGAELTESGLRWLIRHEGGEPKDVPMAYQVATAQVRTPDDAPRLPRAKVYGPAR